MSQLDPLNIVISGLLVDEDVATSHEPEHPFSFEEDASQESSEPEGSQ